MDPLSFGLKCWPQWRGWVVCHLTGDLIDDVGQRTSAQEIRTLLWLASLMRAEARGRVIYADDGAARPAYAHTDAIEQRSSGRQCRVRCPSPAPRCTVIAPSTPGSQASP